MSSQINIFACLSPRIDKSNHSICAAGEIFDQSGVIFMKSTCLYLVTVYVSHQQTRLAHIRSHQKLDLDCIFRPLIINSESSFKKDIVGNCLYSGFESRSAGHLSVPSAQRNSDLVSTHFILLSYGGTNYLTKNKNNVFSTWVMARGLRIYLIRYRVTDTYPNPRFGDFTQYEFPPRISSPASLLLC